MKIYSSVSEIPIGCSDSVADFRHGGAVDAGAQTGAHALGAVGCRRRGLRRKGFHHCHSRWRQLSIDRGAEHAALGLEFTLYLLRNPEARERVAAKRAEVVVQLAQFIVEGMDQLGATLLIEPMTFARALVATSDSVVLGSQLDAVDLYRPMVEMYVSVIKLPD